MFSLTLDVQGGDDGVDDMKKKNNSKLVYKQLETYMTYSNDTAVPCNWRIAS